MFGFRVHIYIVSNGDGLDNCYQEFNSLAPVRCDKDFKS